jgi:hypothetical protein
MHVHCPHCRADYDAPVSAEALGVVDRCERCGRTGLQAVWTRAGEDADGPRPDDLGSPRSHPGRPGGAVAAPQATMREKEAICMIDTPLDQRTAQESAPDEAHVGRYSRGLEDRPESDAKLHRGRFSEGVEQRPENARKRRPGRFSDGLDHDEVQRPERLRGSFADVERDDDDHSGAA